MALTLLLILRLLYVVIRLDDSTLIKHRHFWGGSGLRSSPHPSHFTYLILWEKLQTSSFSCWELCSISAQNKPKLPRALSGQTAVYQPHQQIFARKAPWIQQNTTEKKHASQIFSLRRCLISALCFSSSVPKPTGKHRALSRGCNSPLASGLVFSSFRCKLLNCKWGKTQNQSNSKAATPAFYYWPGKPALSSRFPDFTFIAQWKSALLSSRVLNQISLFLRCKGDVEKGFVFWPCISAP